MEHAIVRKEFGLSELYVTSPGRQFLRCGTTGRAGFRSPRTCCTSTCRLSGGICGPSLHCSEISVEGQRIRTGRRRPSNFVRADQRSEAQIRSWFLNHGQPGSYRFVGRISTDKRACVYRLNSTCLVSRVTGQLGLLGSGLLPRRVLPLAGTGCG